MQNFEEICSYYANMSANGSNTFLKETFAQAEKDFIKKLQDAKNTDAQEGFLELISTILRASEQKHITPSHISAIDKALKNFYTICNLNHISLGKIGGDNEINLVITIMIMLTEKNPTLEIAKKMTFAYAHFNQYLPQEEQYFLSGLAGGSMLYLEGQKTLQDGQYTFEKLEKKYEENLDAAPEDVKTFINDIFLKKHLAPSNVKFYNLQNFENLSPMLKVDLLRVGEKRDACFEIFSEIIDAVVEKNFDAIEKNKEHWLKRINDLDKPTPSTFNSKNDKITNKINNILSTNRNYTRNNSVYQIIHFVGMYSKKDMDHIAFHDATKKMVKEARKEARWYQFTTRFQLWRLARYLKNDFVNELDFNKEESIPPKNGSSSSHRNILEEFDPKIDKVELAQVGSVNKILKFKDRNKTSKDTQRFFFKAESLYRRALAAGVKFEEHKDEAPRQK